MLPLLKARKLYRGDLLYSEGDLADEIIFVLRGSFYLYKDISDMLMLPEKLIDKETQAFNVPFLKYGAQAYFGDEDSIAEIDNGDVSDTKKFYRESTVECVDDAEILVIKRRQLIDELVKFEKIKNFMSNLSKEKKQYHKTLINSILNRYNDPSEAKVLIDKRM